MIVDPDFQIVKDIEVSKYAGVTMGKKEGEIMRELIFKHGFFIRKDSVEFQGTCSIAGGQRVGTQLSITLSVDVLYASHNSRLPLNIF